MNNTMYVDYMMKSYQNMAKGGAVKNHQKDRKSVV